MNCKREVTNDLIIFDVTKDYPEKRINLEDVAEVDYLVLDVSDDDYLFTTFISMSDNHIICRGENRSFLFFDSKTGKPAGKIARFCNGPEEYSIPAVTVYSEAKDELFMLDYPSGIKVYGKDGVFKQKLPYPLMSFFYPSNPNAFFDFDDEHLLIHGFSVRDGMKDSSFVVISKQNGNTDVIPIHYEERVDLMLNQGMAVVVLPMYIAVRNGKDFLLTEYSSDTVYRFTPSQELIPVLVRKPSIQKMQSKVLLHSWQETGEYLFFSTQEVNADWNKLQSGSLFPPQKGYLIEKKTRKYFKTNIQMNDYKGKEIILGPSVISKTSNPSIGLIIWKKEELQDANKANKLTGRLKEVTDSLTQDDEYVFMILKFK